jgi:hypothetical protein
MKISVDTLKSLDVYRKNSALYDEVIKNNQALVNSEGGCLIYFYSLPDVDFRSHPEFEFYPNKLEKIHKSLEAIFKIKLESKLTAAYEELLKKTNSLLIKDRITTVDLMLYASQVDQQSDSIFNNDLLGVIAKLKLEISDLNRNLPEIALPTIIESYIVVNNDISEKSHLRDSKEVPFEMKRPPMVNSLILPIDPNPKYSKIWKGYKLGPMMGHGNKETWKMVKNQWRCCLSKMTWVS